MFFALSPETAVVSDCNEELIALYKTVSKHPDQVIEELKKYKPSPEVEEAEEAIYNQDLTDMTDILREMMKEARRQ